MCLNFLSTFIMNCRLKKRKLPKFLKTSLHPLKEVTKVEKHLLGDQLSLLDLLVKYSVLYMFQYRHHSNLGALWNLHVPMQFFFSVLIRLTLLLTLTRTGG